MRRSLVLFGAVGLLIGPSCGPVKPEPQASPAELEYTDPAPPAERAESSEPVPPKSPAPSADPESKVRDTMLAAYVEAATEAIVREDYEMALQDYDKALEVDPRNATVLLLRAQTRALVATQAKAREASERPGEPRAATLETVHVTAGKPVQDTQGSGAELRLEIRPATVHPGDPYVFRARITNGGSRAISLKSIELEITLGQGRGPRTRAMVAPLVQRVSPRDTTVIWESKGTWTENEVHGMVRVTVTMVGEARLSNELQW